MKIDVFFQLPKDIFNYGLSNNAILLFMFCLDFYKLSEKQKNKINDEFCFFILNDIPKILKITNPTFLKAKNELLEKKFIVIKQKESGKKSLYTIGEKAKEILSFKSKDQLKNFTSKKIIPVKNFNKTSKEILPKPVKKFNQTSKEILPYYKNNYNNIYNNNYNNIYTDTDVITNKNKRKHRYGKNIMLTDQEYETLQKDYGNAEELVQFLDEAISMKGYRYKSHYLAIRKWVVEAVEREKLKKIRNKNIDPLANVKI